MARRLLLLNGIAVLCVILFHATGYGYTAMFSWPHRYRPVTSPNYDQIGTTAYYVLRVVEQLVMFAIPAFLFVSGFFVSILVGRTRATLDARTVWGRIRHLVLPYLFWSALFLFGLYLQGHVYTALEYVRLVATGEFFPNYYYVPLLIQLYAVAPFVALAARWNWKVLLVATGILQLFLYLFQYVVILAPETPGVRLVMAAFPKWFFLGYIFWFAFGVVVGREHEIFRQALDRVKVFLVPCAVLLLVIGVVEWELLLRWSPSLWTDTRPTLIDGLFAVTVIMSLLTFVDAGIPFSSQLMELGGRSYGIYLVHGIVMDYLARGLYHVAPWILGQQILFQPILIVIGLAVPLILMIRVSRSPLRSVYSYVFG